MENLQPLEREVAKEIIAILSEQIQIELEAMEDCYTIAEIAQEVILSYIQNEYRLTKRG
jgi:hypothetical protein